MQKKWLSSSVISILLIALIALSGMLLNARYARLQNGGEHTFTPSELSSGISLVGWEELSPGRWRFCFTAAPDTDPLVLCVVGQPHDDAPEGLSPLGGMDEFFLLTPVAAHPTELIVRSDSLPNALLMSTEAAWNWIELRTNLQLVALVAFVSMSASILALFCFKPQPELGYFLLYLVVMFFWGMTARLSPSNSTPVHAFLSRIYFPIAVLTPLWLCAALLHLVSLQRRRAKLIAVLGTFLLFLIPTILNSRPVRNPILTLEMLGVVFVLTHAYAAGERAALYLLCGYLPTVGCRLLVLLLPMQLFGIPESLPLYIIRCARVYDLTFALGCLVYVCRRFAMQFDRAEQLTLELEQRVARRTQALQNETDARKSMMLNIFHDLRSPLFVVSSGLETLEAASESLPTLLPILQQRVEFIRKLTEDLFLAAKLEQKQILLNEDRLLLDEVSAAVCEGCQTEAQQKKIQLLVDLPSALPVWGDAIRLEQIVQNLLTNAIHYTPAGGTVRVAGSVSGKTVLLCVSDTGCGIAPEDQAAVFDRYFHTTTNTKHDSTGLGLTIAQELAHLHHGEITLESEVGKGSRFTLRLPLLPLD